jgi:hypothetical protein
VFRKYLGGALLRRRNRAHPCLKPSPGKGHWEKQDARPCMTCRPLEARVSRLLRRNFRFRCVALRDSSRRNPLEKKLIGSLSLCPVCGPSMRWLGRYAYSKKVRDSGLWNSNHVGGADTMSSEDLQELERCASQTAVFWRRRHRAR